MAIIYRIINKFKNNEKIKKVLQNIRATTFANILISCIVIFKMIFLKDTELMIINNINWKCIILVIFLIPFIKKFKLPPLFYIALSGMIGIIFRISI